MEQKDQQKPNNEAVSDSAEFDSDSEEFSFRKRKHGGPSKTVGFRLEAAQYDTLVRRANQARLTPGDYARTLVLATMNSRNEDMLNRIICDIEDLSSRVKFFEHHMSRVSEGIMQAVIAPEAEQPTPQQVSDYIETVFGKPKPN